MSQPEYIICLQCETPTYQFEWDKDRVQVALCSACGNDEPADFMTESELEEQSGA